MIKIIKLLSSIIRAVILIALMICKSHETFAQGHHANQRGIQLALSCGGGGGGGGGGSPRVCPLWFNQPPFSCLYKCTNGAIIALSPGAFGCPSSAFPFEGMSQQLEDKL